MVNLQLLITSEKAVNLVFQRFEMPIIAGGTLRTNAPVQSNFSVFIPWSTISSSFSLSLMYHTYAYIRTYIY